MYYTPRDVILISSSLFYILSYLQLLAAATLPNPTDVFLFNNT